MIDPAVGLAEIAPVGAQVGPDRPLAVVHARDEAGADAAERGAARGRPRRRRSRRASAPPWPGGSQVIPKAELHVHLEGTAPPSLVRRLAERNADPAARRSVRGRGHLPLDGFPGLPRHLRHGGERDPHRRRTTATSPTSTSPRARPRAAVYVELIASPGHADAVGLHRRGALRRRSRPGSTTRGATTGSRRRILAAAVRNHGVEYGGDARAAARGGPPPYVVGFQLAGDEAGFPPGPFARAYEIAADSGLGCSVHAGEHAGAESVRGALALPVTRIAHGVRAIEDPALVAELAERGTILEVCPTSNVATGVFASYEDHPLGALREAGVRTCLGSDDPPYFGCSIGSEYAVARERLGVDEGELVEMTRTALEGAFADDGLRRSLLAVVDPANDR